MLVAVTGKQWQALLEVMGLNERMQALATAFEADLTREEERYRIRHAIAALMGEWVAALNLDEIEAAFAGTAVCWSPFRDVAQMLAQDWRASTRNPLFARIDHPGIGPVLTPASPLRFSNHEREGARAGAHPAPVLGADTGRVLGGDR